MKRRNILRAAAAGRSLGVCVCTAGFVLGPLIAAVPAVQAAPLMEAGQENQASRNLRQLRDEVEWRRLEGEVNSLEAQRREAAPPPAAQEPTVPAGAFRFRLEAVTHTPSAILSDEEFTRVTAPFVGRDVAIADLKAMLEAVNALYREKGYVVCEARLAPQRIRGGRLLVTLVEGRTGRTTVSGAEHTSAGYILGAFDLKQGEVANYREMSDALVRFNMTNNVELSVDIRAGEASGTTDYEIRTTEPPNWSASFFADTLGPRSTGRPRAGVSVTNRSVFGRRDAATLLGLVSEGSRSVYASYGMPLNSMGTRLTASVSIGSVDVIAGPSAAGDVEGDSEYYALRLEHPVYVTPQQKWTLWGEWSRQKSETDFFAVTINDVEIDTARAGVEAIVFGSQSVFYFTTAVGHGRVKERTFEERWEQNILTGSAFWRVQTAPDWRVSVSGAWQAVIDGDPLSSSQYFYLGHTSGVRGYDNDVLSAEAGAYVNFEASWAPAGPRTALFAFLDAGRLTGTSSYSRRELASTGLGATWPLWKGASVTATAGFPLIRNLGAGERAGTARFDLAVTASW